MLNSISPPQAAKIFRVPDQFCNSHPSKFALNLIKFTVKIYQSAMLNSKNFPPAAGLGWCLQSVAGCIFRHFRDLRIRNVAQVPISVP